VSWKEQRRAQKAQYRELRDQRAADRKARIAKKYVKPPFKELQGYLADQGRIIDRERELYPSVDYHSR
jgi:hypothetical protein